MTEAEPRTRSALADGQPLPHLSRSRIAALRVGELRDLAASLGIRHSHLTRKAHLVDAITNSLDTDTDTDTDTEQAPQPDGAQPDGAQPDGAQSDGAQQDGAQPDGAQQDSIPTPDEPTFPSPDEPEPTAPEPEAPAAEQPASDALPETVTAAEDAVDEAEGGADPQAGPAVEAEVAGEAQPGESPEDAAAPRSAAAHVNAGITGIAEDLQELQRRETGDAPETGQHDGTHPVDGVGSGDGDAEAAEGEGDAASERPARRGRGRGRSRQGTAQQNGQQNVQPAVPATEAVAPAEEPAEAQPARQQGQGQQGQGAQQSRTDDAADGRRGRYRDRRRRGADGDEPEVRDDDVLIPIAGILDVLDNYAFVRTSGYLAGTNDVYVSLGQVKKYHLRKGDAVVGSIRQLQDGEQPPRQKYNALVTVDSVNGLPVAEAEHRVEFEKLTPLYPQERLRLETEPGKVTGRVIDVVAPIGKGTRGLIVSPPKAGKTVVLQAIANAVAKNNPEAHLMVVLVDERPEEVTEMQRTVKGEVIASTFDRPAEDHTTAAELAIERAKRLVELGYDVVVLLDSITRLGRAYNLVVPQSGRTLDGGVDAAALYPPKRLFGAARNIENGGSLTIIATALVETGSRTDAVILEEFKDSGTMELRLSRALADKRVYPAVDVLASGSRREELLMGPDEVRVTASLRRALAGLEQQAALDVVLGKMTETGTNVEFLVQMQKSLPSGK